MRRLHSCVASGVVVMVATVAVPRRWPRRATRPFRADDACIGVTPARHPSTSQSAVQPSISNDCPGQDVLAKMTNAAFDLDNRDMSLSRFAEALPTAYHYLAASCFCIYNRSEVVPSVWTHAHARLKDSSSKTEAARHVGASAELHLARQFREALLRAGIFGGMSRAINVRHVRLRPIAREQE